MSLITWASLSISFSTPALYGTYCEDIVVELRGWCCIPRLGNGCSKFYFVSNHVMDYASALSVAMSMT